MTPPKKTYVHKPRDLGPLPAFSDITGIGAAFVDNGPTKKKTTTGRASTAQRYKMILEIWTVPPERLSKRDMQFKRNVELRTPNEFEKHVIKQEKDGVIDLAYRDHLLSHMASMPLDERERCLFGQIRENKDGWRYFPFEYVMFEDEGEDGHTLFLFKPKGGHMDAISVSRFNDHFAKPPIHLTAYLDVDDKLKQYKEANP